MELKEQTVSPRTLWFGLYVASVPCSCCVEELWPFPGALYLVEGLVEDRVALHLICRLFVCLIKGKKA